MCNLYDIGPASAKQSRGWERLAVEALSGISKIYGIRRTDPGLVVHREAKTNSLVPEVMRWGFVRDFSTSINNARSDKLETGVWNAAWRERRCVIPVGAFYEWSGGEKGAKQTYALRDASGGWLWMAGLWERNREHGLCFAMITTEARGPIAAIHDRMPAILAEDQIEAFLEAPAAGDPVSEWSDLRSELEIFPCLNPFKTHPAGPPEEDRFLF